MAIDFVSLVNGITGGAAKPAPAKPALPAAKPKGGIDFVSLVKTIAPPPEPVAPVSPPLATRTLPAHLGGGQIALGPTAADKTLDTVAQAKKTQSALPAKTGSERNHIIPPLLGGTSNIENLNYQAGLPSQKGSDAGNRDIVEQSLENKVKTGQIGKRQAIVSLKGEDFKQEAQAAMPWWSKLLAPVAKTPLFNVDQAKKNLGTISQSIFPPASTIDAALKEQLVKRASKATPDIVKNPQPALDKLAASKAEILKNEAQFRALEAVAKTSKDQKAIKVATAKYNALVPQQQKIVDEHNKLAEQLQGAAALHMAKNLNTPGVTQSVRDNWIATGADWSGKFLGAVGGALSLPFTAINAVEKGIGAATTGALRVATGQKANLKQAYATAPTIGGVISESGVPSAIMQVNGISQPEHINVPFVGDVPVKAFTNEFFGQLADIGVGSALLGVAGTELATRTGLIKITPEQLNGKAPIPEAQANFVQRIFRDAPEDVIKQVKENGIEIKVRAPAGGVRQAVGETVLGGNARTKQLTVKIPGYEPTTGDGFAVTPKLLPEAQNGGATKEGTSVTSTSPLDQKTTPIAGMGVFHGAKGVVTPHTVSFDNAITIPNDQHQLIDHLAAQGDTKAAEISKSLDFYKEADPHIAQVFKGKVDAIKYENKHLPEKGIEIHDIAKSNATGEQTFYSKNEQTAQAYALQNREAKYTPPPNLAEKTLPKKLPTPKIDFIETNAFERLDKPNFEMRVASDFEHIWKENRQLDLPTKTLSDAWKKRTGLPLKTTSTGEIILYRGGEKPTMGPDQYLTANKEDAAQYGTPRSYAVDPRDISFSAEEKAFLFEPRVDKNLQPYEEIPVSKNPTHAIPKDLQPLAKEAMKYKSAEEFALAKFANPDKQYALQEFFDKGNKLNADGTVDLYHATTKERAQQIIKDGKFLTAKDAPDNYGVYFSTDPSVSTDYGDGTLIKVRVPFKDLNLDDAFPNSKRMDFQVNTKKGSYQPVEVGKNLTSKSQLTDFYNQVKGQEVEPKKAALPTKKPSVEKYGGMTKGAYKQMSKEGSVYPDHDKEVAYQKFKQRFSKFNTNPPEDVTQFKAKVPESKNWFYSQQNGESDDNIFDQFVQRYEHDRSVTLNAGINPNLDVFIAEDLKPALKEFGGGVANTWDFIKKTFAPATRGGAAGKTVAIMREELARMARRKEVTFKTLEKARKTLDKFTKQQSIDFIDNLENGRPNPGAEKFGDVVRTALESRWRKIQEIKGTDAYIENYFPHIWKDPAKAATTLAKFFGKRPLEGTKSYLKQRKIPTIKEGIELGLEPTSYNPVDLVMARVADMDRFIMAHDAWEQFKTDGLRKFVRSGQPVPEGWAKVNDKISNTFAGANIQYTEGGKLYKGVVQQGSWYMPEEAATVVNNYLSPGLTKNSLYNAFRMIGNQMNQVQLGLSGFHAMFTSMDAVISHAALDLQKGTPGSIARAVVSPLTSPYVLWQNLTRGNTLLKDYYRANPEVPNMVDALQRAGGRVRMDSFYQNDAVANFLKSLRGKNYIGAFLRAPGAMIEAVAKPIMQELVPRQKLGIFADGAKFIMEKAEKENWSEYKTTLRLQELWDSVDNRMGQMVYDNLFWNKVLKDMGMVATRSLGWNLGTVRELGGGAAQIGKLPAQIFTKEGRANIRMTPKMAYTIMLPYVVGVIGAIIYYLYHGKAPETLKDYYAIPTGQTKPDGTKERILLPSYMKDVLAYMIEPTQTVSNKVHPEIATLIDMLQNKDYFGTEIRNADDPFVKQLGDLFAYQAKQYVPFTITNIMQRQADGGSWKDYLQSFAGITPAPGYITRTPLQTQIYELYDSRFGGDTKSQEQTAVSKQKAAARAAYLEGDSAKANELLKDLVKNGVIKPNGVNTFVADADIPNDIKLFQRLSPEDQTSLVKRMSLYELQRYAWYVNSTVKAHFGSISDNTKTFVEMGKAGEVKEPKWKRQQNISE